MGIDFTFNFDIKRTYKVNGQEYHSVEEMPPEIRAVYEKASAMLPATDLNVKKQTVTTKISFNGTNYSSVDEMPEDIRTQYKCVMGGIRTNIPQPAINPALPRRDLAGKSRKPIQTAPLVSLNNLALGLLGIALFLAFYFFLRSK